MLSGRASARSGASILIERSLSRAAQLSLNAPTPPLERESKGGAVSGGELQPTVTVSFSVLSGPMVVASGIPFIGSDFVSNLYVPDFVKVRDCA